MPNHLSIKSQLNSDGNEKSHTMATGGIFSANGKRIKW